MFTDEALRKGPTDKHIIDEINKITNKHGGNDNYTLFLKPAHYNFFYPVN